MVSKPPQCPPWSQMRDNMNPTVIFVDRQGLRPAAIGRWFAHVQANGSDQESPLEKLEFRPMSSRSLLSLGAMPSSGEPEGDENSVFPSSENAVLDTPGFFVAVTCSVANGRL